MATLNDLYVMDNDVALTNRIVAACWNEAKDIFTEEPGVENHAARLQWARGVFHGRRNGPMITPVRLAAVVVLQDNGDPTDAEIQEAVSQVVLLLAV